MFVKPGTMQCLFFKNKILQLSHRLPPNVFSHSLFGSGKERKRSPVPLWQPLCCLVLRLLLMPIAPHFLYLLYFHDCLSISVHSSRSPAAGVEACEVRRGGRRLMAAEASVLAARSGTLALKFGAWHFPFSFFLCYHCVPSFLLHVQEVTVL